MAHGVWPSKGSRLQPLAAARAPSFTSAYYVVVVLLLVLLLASTVSPTSLWPLFIVASNLFSRTRGRLLLRLSRFLFFSSASARGRR